MCQPGGGGLLENGIDICEDDCGNRSASDEIEVVRLLTVRTK